MQKIYGMINDDKSFSFYRADNLSNEGLLRFTNVTECYYVSSKSEFSGNYVFFHKSKFYDRGRVIAPKNKDPVKIDSEIFREVFNELQKNKNDIIVISKLEDKLSY